MASEMLNMKLTSALNKSVEHTRARARFKNATRLSKPCVVVVSVTNKRMSGGVD